MRLLLLSDINSSHTQKWALGLTSAGFEVGIFSVPSPVSDWFSEKQIRVFNFNPINRKAFRGRTLMKGRYLISLKYLNTVIRDFEPDILHAHYATSYGMLGRMSGHHPFLLSVWGSDVLDFPKKSFVHKWLLRKNLLAADTLFSTSKVLHDDVLKLSGRDSVIIPFGVNTNVFKPQVKVPVQDALVIGTIKTLEKHYCIDILIKAFAKLLIQSSCVKINLLIVGEGSEESKLKALTRNLGINDAVTFAGKVPYFKIHEYHNMIDVFANLSEYESFGVSVLEASSCGKPVVVSDTGGLREVVIKDRTGLIVPVKDVEATVSALSKLVSDKELRNRMGAQGRKYVIDYYDWKECLRKMIEIYRSL